MRVFLLTIAAALVLAAPTAAAPATVFTGDTVAGAGVACGPQEDIVFCSGSGTSRVRTFDDVPLDVNVALPAAGEGPFPLVIHIHGWGGQREGIAEGKKWASRGYAWMSVTARGFNGSCGTPQNRNDAACAQGWIRLADSRYEVRDLQYLAGLLVDEDLVDPQKIGAYGGSYGGGQSTMLAVLRDRVRMEDGSYTPWVSPEKKLPMQLAAAVPSIPWTDLVYSLMPNGRTLDYTVVDADDDLNPVGVMKRSFVSGLYALGSATGFYAPPGADPEADLQSWYQRVSAGDPYDADPTVQQMVDVIAGFKSPYYLDMDRVPAPTLISNGFTDDLFPVDEAVRYVNKVKALHPSAVIAQLHFDYGHQRGQNKAADTALLAAERFDWMDRYLRGEDTSTLEGVTVKSQTCPKDAASGGPFSAPSWDALSPGEIRLADPAEKSVLSGATDPDRNRTWDPIVAGSNPCATNDDGETPGTATWSVPPATGDGYTLAGSPTFLADVAVTGTNSSFAARLLDVSPDGKQTLVARGLFRPESEGRQVFQLHPNVWRFAPGHTAKLEILGNDEPYGRAPNFQFALSISNFELRLPTLEQPDCTQVLSPAPPFLPAGATPAPGVDTAPVDRCAPAMTSGAGDGTAPGGGGSAPGGGTAGSVLGSRSTGAAPSCLARRARLGSRGVGRLRIGHQPPRIERRQGRPAATGERAYRYCISGGGVAVVVFSRKGDARLILTTGRRHEAIGSAGPGDPVAKIRRTYPGTYKTPVRGLYATRRSSRVLFAFQRGRVAWAGVADRRLLKSRVLLRRYVRLARGQR